MSEKYKELLEQYDVKVLSTFRSRGTFQCETEQGLALLKEYHGSLQKLALEYEWKEKLANAGFLTTDRYFLTKEESLVTYDRYRTPFVLKHYFKGRECDCRNLSDVAASCRNLAFLHKVSSSIEEIPFEKAAEIGTKKVIQEHSTIGIVMTTDGSITDIPREDYINAEERVVKELKELNKPFVIVLNSDDPFSDYTKALAKKLEEKYGVSVLPTDCARLDIEDIDDIFSKILYEFPIETINIDFPRWVDGLPDDHWLKVELYDEIEKAFDNIRILKQVDSSIGQLQNTKVITRTSLTEVRLGEGSVRVSIELVDELFYKVLTEISGVEIDNEGALFSTMTEFARTKKQYDKIAYALEEVKATGYGIVTPSIDELILEEPEMVKQGTRFGVKLKAKAPSIHMIRADIETEVSPIVGSEKQSEDLVNYLLSEFESDPKKIWESNIFGKNLHELVNEGLQNKLARMPDDAQAKLQETLERIVNEGSGGLICIIL